MTSKPSQIENEDPFDAIVDEVLEHQRAGRNPQLASFEQRYPEHANELREIFSTLLLAERMEEKFSRDTQSSVKSERTAFEYPRQIGDFELLHELGRGGMGVVFAARQISLNRLVAIKLLSSHLASDARFAERFAREARSAARLHHPHIVSVFSNGCEQGFSYYSMQLIEGKNLAEVLSGVKQLLAEGDMQPAGGDGDYPRRLLSSVGSKEANSPAIRGGPATAMPTTAASVTEGVTKPLTMDAGVRKPVKRDSAKLNSANLSDSAKRAKREAYYKNIAALARDVAWALEYAHQQGTIHRDIKPSNLILDSSGHVWVTDFGLAKLDSEQRMTQAGDILGTLRYVAPEQLDGVTAPSCDVYGVGVTLYELVTLQPAWSGENHAQIMQRVRSDSVVRPRSIEPTTPRDLETIILTAMAREPADRYRSARELGDDLERFCNDQPIRARKPSTFETLLRWSRRNRLAAVSIASALFLAAVVVPVITISYSMMWRAEATRARKAEQDTSIANANSKQRLVESLIQQARAVRENRSIAAREDCIKTLQAANQVLAELEPSMSWDAPAHQMQLREEAAAALALPSFRESVQVPLKETNRKLSEFIQATDSLLVFRERIDKRDVTSIYDAKDLNQPIHQFDFYADLAHINRQKTHVITHSNFHDGLMDLAVWRISDGNKIFHARNPPFQGLYSPGHDYLIALDQTGRPLTVNFATGKVTRGPVVCDPRRPLPSLWCSPSMEALALVYFDQVEVRRFQDGRLLRRIRRPRSSVEFEIGYWSPIDNWFAIKSTDGTISFYDPKSWDVLRAVSADSAQGTILSSTADGRYLESKTWNKRIEVFDVNTGERVANVSLENDSQFINFSNYMVGPVCDTKQTRMLNLVPSPVYRLHGFSPDTALKLRDLIISPDGKLAVVQVRRGELGLLDLQNGRQLLTPTQVSGLSFVEKGDLWGMTEGQLLQWPLISAESVIRFGEPIPVTQTEGTNFAIDPSGQLLVWNEGGGVSSCNVGHLADVKKWKIGGDVRKLAVSPDRKWVVGSGHNENGCWVFEATSNRRWVLAPNSRLTVPCFSADGRFFALTVPGESLQLFRCGEWEKPIMTWGPAIGQPAFTPDGRLLAASFDVNSISLIRTEDFEILQRLTHPDELTVLSLSFTPDGTRLLFTSEESNCVHEWNLAALEKELDLIGISADVLTDARTLLASPFQPESIEEEWIEFAPESHLLQRLDQADRMHNKKQIRDCLERLCRAVPNNPKYSNWLAWDFIQDPKSTLDQKTEALGLVRNALEQDGTNGNYLNTYGVVLLRLGYVDEAISALEDARNQRRDEDSSADNYFLAIAFAKNGNYVESVKCWSLGIRSQFQHGSTHVDSWNALLESTGFLLHSLTGPKDSE